MPGRDTSRADGASPTRADLPLEQTEPAIAERVRRGVPFDLAAQPRVRWRSNYVRDPGGNVVERGAFGPAVLEQPE